MRIALGQRAKRNKLWGQQEFLNELRGSRTIKDVCLLFADENSGWKGYYFDVLRWRKMDETFDKKVRNHIKLVANGKDQTEGRPRNDDGNTEWQDDFCEALVIHNGNRNKAAAVTPYSYRQIVQFLNPDYTSYDKEFYDKVRATELQLVAQAEEMLLSLLDEGNYSDLDRARIAQVKAMVSSKILEKYDKPRFGKEMKHLGQIELRHKHSHEFKLDNIERLIDDQRAYMEGRLKSLPREEKVIELTKEEYIEVETEDEDE